MERAGMIRMIKELIPELNHHRHLYYNTDTTEITDSEYDEKLDLLADLERRTGFIMANSPTQTVGFGVVSALEKTEHPIPLLSLDKTKDVDEAADFVGDRDVLAMFKLDGLTIQLDYEDGVLVEASTRGDGVVGDVVTHNAWVFKNVPTKISKKGTLSLAGEAIIRLDDFARMKDELVGSDGKPYRNARSLAAGSVRLLEAEACVKRNIYFYAFSVLSGLEDVADEFNINSKAERLGYLKTLGFDVVRFERINPVAVTNQPTPCTLADHLEKVIYQLKAEAERSHILIDGIVFSYDDVKYSHSLGRTGHHYKDGKAFKFEDGEVETVLRGVDWQVTRTGELSATAMFDPVETSDSTVSRAVLHNLDIIKKHGVRIGHRITISKRGTTIPHVERNLDKGKDGQDFYLETCPSCGTPLLYEKKPVPKGRKDKQADGAEFTESVRCPNESCPGRKLRKLMYYTGKKGLDVPGVSKGKLQKLMDAGFLDCEADLFKLWDRRIAIVRLNGFGPASVDNMLDAIEASKSVTVDQFIRAMDIPDIGDHVSPLICDHFNNDLDAFEQAAMNGYDFSILEDIGPELNSNIHAWFRHQENRDKWALHKSILNIQIPEKKENVLMSSNENVFAGKTIVITGKLDGYTRETGKDLVRSVGAKAGSTLSGNTDYLLVGEKPGGKLDKARDLGVKIIYQDEFMKMAGLNQ